VTQANTQPNTFTFTADNVLITYQSSHFIDRPDLPSLTYQNKVTDTTLTFHQDEIRTQQSELGTLVSVSLNKSVDAGATVLTVLLPDIRLAGATEQSFQTLGIVTRSFGILPVEGAELVYDEVLNLYGVATLMPLL
jgi:hypothetical protein